MPLQDNRQSNAALKKVAHQADFAAVGFLSLAKVMVTNGTLSVEDATGIMSEALSMASHEQRGSLIAIIQQFLPDYQPPRFSAFGPGFSV